MSKNNKRDYTGVIVAGVLLALALFGIIDAHAKSRASGNGLERLPMVSGDIREVGGQE